MKQIAIIGASGYAGAQFTALLAQADPSLAIYGLYVSEQSPFLGQPFAEVYPAYYQVDQRFQALDSHAIQAIAQGADAVVLATEHQVSVELAAQFIEAGLIVFDLSGAYRFTDADIFPKWYGFSHQQPHLLKQAVYGLVGWQSEQSIQQAQLIAVPGCYPTASLLALKPLTELLDPQVRPVINAVSGVSGAGRKALPQNSFCEVSLNAYGVLNHRHQPEIETHLGLPVIFTPHLGNFKRGILATITVKLNDAVAEEMIEQAYQLYQDQPFIQVVGKGAAHPMPKLDEVVNTPLCRLGWQYDPQSHYLVVVSVIDNLMKGAASQALECIKIHFQR